MCGDLDEEEDLQAEQLYAAFVGAAQAAIHEAREHRGGARDCLSDDAAPPSASAAERTCALPPAFAGVLELSRLHRYMDGVFAELLEGCIRDGVRLAPSEQYRLLSAQAVVLARAAGFLAARLDRREEPLRSCLDALTTGYDS